MSKRTLGLMLLVGATLSAVVILGCGKNEATPPSPPSALQATRDAGRARYDATRPGAQGGKLKDASDMAYAAGLPSAMPVDGDGINGEQLGQSSEWNREAYDSITENAFAAVADHPLSTFSIDVDTASYSNMRRHLTSGQLPPAGAVRIEELVNYFPYTYTGPDDDHPFAVHTEGATCPWNTKHRLVRVGIQGKKIDDKERAPANLVFLLDVSGSMSDTNKLPLVKSAMKMLLENLREDDRVGIAVYAGSSGLVLDSTAASEKAAIARAIDNLSPGGSTNGAAGIELAYQVATKGFIKGGVNRVILCTDGDFNVGTTSRSELVKLVEAKAKSGVFLTVLGFGMGNYNDAMMEELTNKGNGNYGYVDNEREARKLLVEQVNATMVTIAKDVKIQVEFNPAKVAGYRLIGYENRMLKKEDFNDDTKDAGEIGAGHSVTALYEVVPFGVELDTPKVDPLKYQPVAAAAGAQGDKDSGEMLTVKIRYKQPEGDKSQLIAKPFTDDGRDFARASEDMRFAASVAAMGMILRDSKFVGTYTLGAVAEVAESSAKHDPSGYRKEFVELVKKAAAMKKS